MQTADERDTAPPLRRWQRLVGRGWHRGARWFLAEFLVVVTGVLVALAVNAWWQDRSDRAFEQEMLRSLRAEFLRNRELLNRYIALHRQYESHGLHLLAPTRAGPVPTGPVPDPRVSLNWVFLDCASISTSFGALDALFASGRINLVGDDSLRAALAAWPSAAAEMTDEEDRICTAVQDRYVPFLATRVPLAPLYGAELSYYGSFPDSRHEWNPTPLLSSLEFENHVVNRVAMERWAIRELVELRGVMDTILRRIDGRLGQLR